MANGKYIHLRMRRGTGIGDGVQIIRTEILDGVRTVVVVNDQEHTTALEASKEAAEARRTQQLAVRRDDTPLGE